MDALSAVEDEVALEGLDGITLPSLWIRLQDRNPKFPLKLDDHTKAFLWRSLVHNCELTFYEQPQEREDVELYDRFKYIDPDTGIEDKGHSFEIKKDVYPVQIVPENKAGIQGSCVFFTQRRDVTKEIRSASYTPLLSLDQAWERFGRRLVVVASQKLRFRTLIGSESDPDLKLTDESYCMLERVGRARWQGELQRDLHNGSFKIDPRKVHYLRKSLVKHGLVTIQSHVSRLSTGLQQHSCLLLLKRFHVNRRSKYDILMERVSNILQLSPGQYCSLMALRDHLNVDERTFKRIFQYMRSSKLVEFFSLPLDEMDPEAGPCVNKRGNKVQVRCLKLVKPYSQKGVPDDDDDEDEDRGDVRPEGRVMERDILSQAYDMVVSSGTTGMTCVAIGHRMNVGKLERRMICRQLEREGVIKGFLEDMGRQRTTKFLSHKCVDVSDKLHQFVKEHERNKLLCSSSTPDSPKPPSASKTLSNIDMCRTPAPNKNKVRVRKSVKGKRLSEEVSMEPGHRGTEGGVQTTPEQKDQPELSVEPAAGETSVCADSRTSAQPDLSAPSAETTSAAEEGDVSLVPASAHPQGGEAKETVNIAVVTDVPPRLPPSRNHETCRLLRRKNLIVEAIQDLKILEGLFPLQKIINDEEKRLGFSTKCCKKTILRLVHALAREGLVKLYTTTVIQDGMTRKVDLFAHPSIQPTDEIVQRIIDQVRFKISSSYTAGRLLPDDEKSKGQSNNASKSQKNKANRKSLASKNKDKFKPTTVRGLSKVFGYQPKMHRLSVVHNYLWYMIYGHPLRHNPDTQAFEKADPTSSDQNASDPPTSDPTHSEDGSRPPPTTNKDDDAPKDSNTNKASLSEEEEEEEMPQSEFKVYSEEEPWKKYVPPVRVHKDYSSGWAMMGDLLLCLPLSVFIQIIQINYEVEGLEDYLNDPEKQHYLVRCLPAKMKRQLLFRRRYIFSFYENLQKLAYMGLIQFGPMEKFRDKDQVFIYLKRHATIVDTTSSEPHYWLVSEPLDRPFERRHYTFNTVEDTENYWFDLMCVCLNTPLGVVRSKRSGRDEDSAPSFVRERAVFVGMAYLLKGSLDVVDDGSIPGDGKGAGGLDSEFFSHMKRNWLWTNHLLAVKPKQSGLEAKDTKIRLKSLCKNALQIVLQAEGSSRPRYVTAKKKLITEEDVQVVVEPASRNKQVVGGKQQKRKRVKKEVVKPPRKKKEPRKRTPAHDERDHEALKQMTRQRVYWSLQEDSLMMLCAVAAHLLNSKLKRPFVPYCVVRDVLHKEFEKSRDKTSVAVGRRTRYILKNPQTLLNYRICLAEVGQDKALLKLLEEKKPKDPEKPEACTESFSEYIRLLRQKFSTTMDPTSFIIPDSKHQLFSQFKISAIDDGKRRSYTDILNCTDDIHSVVLHNLIQSTLAMTNSQMKSSRSFQTFHIYSSYSQELLCQVFIQCRKRGLINRRRVNQGSGPKKNRALPILPMSYQLSQSYYRCFSWRFPQALCSDSFRFIRNLLNLPRGDDRAFTYFHQETENRSPDGELVQSRKPSEVKKDKTQKERNKNGESATTGESANKEPQTVTEQPKEAESGEQMDLEEEQTGETSEDSPDASDMLQFSLDAPGGACVAALTLMSLGLLSVFMSIPKQMVVVDSSLVDCDVVKSMTTLDDEEEDEDEGEESKKMEVKAHQASHTKYLMMRGYCVPGIVKLRNLSTNDNIVVESCVMKVQLRDRPAHHLFTVEQPALDLSKSGPSLLPPVLSPSMSTPSLSAEECVAGLAEHRGYSAEDIQACTLLWDTLDRAGERGLDVHEFCQTHRELEQPQPGRTRTLQYYMQDLEAEGQVVLVGAEGTRWVLRHHAQPWLITVNTGQWTRTCTDTQPFSSHKHDIPFMRKRRRPTRDSAEGTPAKRQALDTCKDQDGERRTEEQLQGGEEEREESREETREESREETREETREAIQEDEQVGGAEEDSQEKKNGEGMNAQPEEEKGEVEQKEEEEGEKGEEEESEKKDENHGRRQRRATQSCKNPCCASDITPEEAPRATVSFVSRPWRMVDGKLNRLVCKGMLEAVLYQIMSLPGLTQEALLQHYKDVLQPVAVLDLVQALINLGCVKKKTLVKRPRQSLFSRSVPPPPPPQSGTGVAREQPDTVYYEPTVCCVLRLSQVLPHERHWNSETP